MVTQGSKDAASLAKSLFRTTDDLDLRGSTENQTFCCEVLNACIHLTDRWPEAVSVPVSPNIATLHLHNKCFCSVVALFHPQSAVLSPKYDRICPSRSRLVTITLPHASTLPPLHVFIGPPPPRSLRYAYRSTTLQVRIATLARLCEAYVLLGSTDPALQALALITGSNPGDADASGIYPGFFCVETHALVKAGRLDAAMDVLRRCVGHGGCTIDVCRQCLRLLALAPGTTRHQVNAAFAAVFTAFSDPAAGKIGTPLFPVR